MAQGTQSFKPGSSPGALTGFTKTSAAIIIDNHNGSLPHDRAYNGRKVRVQRGPITQENVRFSRMGRQSQSASATAVMDIVSRLGHLAGLAISGAVRRSVMRDEFGE
jgi:hypothetical protein